MLFSVELIKDIPYSSFNKETITMEADDLDSLITEVIPERSCREMEILRETVWEKIKWKHVNMKFSFQDIQIEFVFDQEKRNRVTVYICSLETGEVLSVSDSTLLFTDDKGLSEEVKVRASEAGIIHS